jgi:hypothetical protein
MDTKKRIILNTKESNETNISRKNFKYYFDKPIEVKKKSILKHQGTHYIKNDAQQSYTTGILNLKHISVDQTTIVQSGFSSVYAQFYNININSSDTNYAGPGSSGVLNMVVFRDWGATNSNPPYRIEVANLFLGGSGYVAGETFTIHQSQFGGTHDSSITITIDDVMTSQGEVDDTGKVTNVSDITFDSNYYEYSAGTPGIVSVSTNVLGQGLVLRFGVNSSRVPFLDEIITQGHSFKVGTVLWIDKNKLYYNRSASTGYYTPQKITLTAVTPPLPPATNDPTKAYQMKIKGLLNNVGNITNSEKTGDMIGYTSKRVELYNELPFEYKIGDLEPQIIMGMELEFKSVSTTGDVGLSVITDAIVDLVIE